MKKAYKYFNEKMNLWLVYPICVIVMYVYTLAIFVGLSYYVMNESLSMVTPSGRTLLEAWILACIPISILLGLAFTFIISGTRKSKLFWVTSEVLKDKVNQANTEDEIMNLKSEFDTLKDLIQGSPHAQEYNVIINFANGKLQGLKNSK